MAFVGHRQVLASTGARVTTEHVVVGWHSAAPLVSARCPDDAPRRQPRALTVTVLRSDRTVQH